MAASDDKPRAEKAKALPKARVVDREPQEGRQDSLRMIRIGGFLLALVGGCLFILAQNKFDPTPPVVFVCLGYLALLSAIYALWRTGVVVADENEEYADSTWDRPTGARSELEREKKSLLKAIKEAEFDREMGKLSKADAEQMIAVYRARAIDVIKALDKPSAGEGTVREQIAREVKARLELEEKTKQTEAEAKASKKLKNTPELKNKSAKEATADAAAAAEKAASAAEKAAAAAVAAATPSSALDAASAEASADAAADQAQAAAAEAREAANDAHDALDALAAKDSEDPSAKPEGATS